MLRFKQFILEYLNPAQKDKVNSWLPDKESGRIYSPRAEEISSHIIPEGKHHIVIPAVAHTMRAVHAHLDKHGYINHDYVTGNTTDKHGRQVSIGKVLEKTKATEQLKNDYANDDKAQAKKLEDHDIVISRHPYHVAESSTNKPWKSCAGLTATGRFCSYGDGVAAKKLPQEIKHGTHVAYLVPKLKPGEETDDSFNGAQSRIDKATARILLKPHSSEQSGHTVLVPENKVYQKQRRGAYEGKNVGFLRSLESFTNEHFPMKEGEVYKKHNQVYDDDGTMNEPKFNTSDKSLNKLNTSDNPRVRATLRRSKNLTSEQLHKLIDYYDHPEHDKEAMHDLAFNPNLKHDHITKLLSRNISLVNEGLSSNPKLHKTHVDHLVSLGNDTIDLGLGFNKNKKLLSKDHIHRIIDNSLRREKEIGDSIKSRDGSIHDFHDTLHSSGHEQNMLSMLNHENIKPEHIDKIITSDNPYIHNRLIEYHSHHLTNNHLQQMIDKWKDKDLSRFNGWYNPHLKAVNKLKDRLQNTNEAKTHYEMIKSHLAGIKPVTDDELDNILTSKGSNAAHSAIYIAHRTGSMKLKDHQKRLLQNQLGLTL